MLFAILGIVFLFSCCCSTCYGVLGGCCCHLFFCSSGGLWFDLAFSSFLPFQVRWFGLLLGSGGFQSRVLVVGGISQTILKTPIILCTYSEMVVQDTFAGETESFGEQNKMPLFQETELDLTRNYTLQV